MVSTIRRFLADERGVTAVEYGLLIALITVALIGAWTMLGDTLDARFNNLSELVTR